jgi:hypothetical protein
MSLIFKTRDKNRYRKTYPRVRRKPVYELVSNKPAIIEVGIVDFNNTSTGTYYYKNDFSTISSGNPPVISLTVQSTGSEIITAFVSSPAKADPNTGDSLTIETTAPFTGKVHVQIMEIGS